MRITARHFSVTTAVLLFAVATSCAQSPGGTGPTTKPDPSSKAPTSTSPESQEDRASTDAEDAVRAYFKTVDALQQDPSEDLEGLSKVAIGVQLNAQKLSIEQLRKAGRHQTGNTDVAEMKVQSVNLDNSDPKAGKVPTVTVDACWDVAGVDVVDKIGKSVVSPDRPDDGWTRFTVANYHWSENPNGGWRVANGQDLEQPSCKAS